jgi:hypothetical protein
VPTNLSQANAAACSETRSLSKIQAVGIVILARNHSETIAKCVASIFAANSYSGWRNSLWIVAIADACTDDTAKEARKAIGAFGQVFELCTGSRQAAHQLGASAVMDHFQHLPRHTLLLTSTDAAAEFPRDWIELQLQRGTGDYRKRHLSA